MLLVGEEHDLDIGVAGARDVLGRESRGADHLEGEGEGLEVVRDAELDLAQLVVDALHRHCVRLLGAGVVHQQVRDAAHPLPHARLLVLRRRPALAGQAEAL